MTTQKFQIASVTTAADRETFLDVPGNGLDILGRLLAWNPPLSRERLYYLYDRTIRVDATKARQQLGW